MGCFSWYTCDTQRPISLEGTEAGAFPVWIILSNGTKDLEEHYEGYGRFGRFEFFSTVARETLGDEICKDQDHDTLRSWGIDLCYSLDPNDPSSSWGDIQNGGDELGAWARAHTPDDVKVPKLSEDPNRKWADLPNPKSDPNQGCG